jgi:hypothetical protein
MATLDVSQKHTIRWSDYERKMTDVRYVRLPRVPDWFWDWRLAAWILDDDWCTNGCVAIRYKHLWRQRENPVVAYTLPQGSREQLDQWLDTSDKQPAIMAALPGKHYVNSELERLVTTNERNLQARYVQVVEELYPNCQWWMGPDRFRPVVATWPNGVPVAAVQGTKHFPCCHPCCQEE